jgi:hypothetical protein
VLGVGRVILGIAVGLLAIAFWTIRARLDTGPPDLEPPGGERSELNVRTAIDGESGAPL